MQQADYGSWDSKISAQAMVASNVGLVEVKFFRHQVFQLESRPQEGGRCVLVQHLANGQRRDVNPAPFNIRSRVHEYAGNAFVFTDNAVIYSHFVDQQLYIQRYNSEADNFDAPQQLTHSEGLRFADAVFDAQRQRLVCVCEDHRDTSNEPVNSISCVDLKTGSVEVLVSGSDFYASPQLNASNTRLAWVQWQHPNMPWDTTALYTGELHDGDCRQATCIAGGDDTSVLQPQWYNDDQLIYASDESGWWNLYLTGDKGARALCPREAEFASPMWQLGTRNYCLQQQHIIANYHGPSGHGVCSIDVENGDVQQLQINHQLRQLVADDDRWVAIGFSSTEFSAVVQYQAQQLSSLFSSVSDKLDDEYYSIAQSISYTNKHKQTCYAYYYPPKNPDYQAPAGQLPPLITQLHGGPTGAASSGLSLAIQFWTSRGFAVVDVNYGGSTGFGREYRNRLLGQWGVVDVDDTVAAVQYLIEQGLVDAKQCAIRGGSAGGYTTLAALAFNDVFSAGASYYGVGDIEALAADTHKFESRYCDNLIGPYPEAKDVYQARSPINSLEHFNCPVIFFQGAEDKIVPPNQAEMMVAELDKQQIPVAYVLFDNEQHGFRRSENIIQAFNSEWLFYAKVFGFELKQDLPDLQIKHLAK